MANMVEMDLAALKSYASDLEAFKARMNQHCTTLETGISNCGRHMLDEPSQSALQKGRQVVNDIRACLDPTERILEKVYQLIIDLEKASEYTL